jgi:hypothetical protein
MIRKLSLCLLFIALLLSIAAQDDKTYSADRFDVDVAAQYDRSLLVEESVTFRFVGGPFSFVFRELPTDHTDGITDIVAGMDGVPWPQGTGPGQVEITGRDPIVVTWHLSPTSDAVQTFTLSYRALGVVRQDEAADVLNWQALPDEYEYGIASNRVTVSFPAQAQLLGQPEVLAGKSAVAVDGNQAIFTQGNLSAGDPLVVRLSFAPGAFSATPPAWQAQREAQNSRAWIWFVVAAAVLTGGLWAVFAAAHPFTRPTPKATDFLYKPPADLPPALVGYLFNSSIGWQHGLATLFDLAKRGVIEIEQLSEKSLWREAQFTITLLDRPPDLRPHESALLDLLFTDKSGAEQEVVTLAEMGRLITSSRWKRFTEILEEEAGREGLTDPAAGVRQQRLMVWGVVLMLLAALLLIPTFLFGAFFGAWPLVAIGAVVLVGIFAMIAAASISPLSDKGAQYAAAFEPFRRYLNDVAKGKTQIYEPSFLETFLPYATAFGFAEQWVKSLAKSEVQQIPSYFRAMTEAGGAEMAAFIAVIAATSSSGGAAAAAGAAGAAAAGGGASGAG